MNKVRVGKWNALTVPERKNVTLSTMLWSIVHPIDSLLCMQRMPQPYSAFGIKRTVALIVSRMVKSDVRPTPIGLPRLSKEWTRTLMVAQCEHPYPLLIPCVLRSCICVSLLPLHMSIGFAMDRVGKKNAVPRVMGPLKRVEPAQVRDVEFLRKHSRPGRRIKITIPGPFSES
jgi:hypothetical protein